MSEAKLPKTLMLSAALGLGAAWGAPSVALALDPPARVEFQLGTWKLDYSVGLDGFVYALTGTGDAGSLGLLGTDKSKGAKILNGLAKVEKTEGLFQFAVQVGGVSSWTMGTKPTMASAQTYSSGPLYTGSLTLAPTSDFSISAGRLGSLEGYESTVDWLNSNVLATSIFFVQNSVSNSISATYTAGPVSTTLMFGDGFDTYRFNFLQASGTYTFDDSNNLTLYGATNVGRTGLSAHTYGSSTVSWNATTVGSYGANFVNSSMAGAYYSYTNGGLNIVPELQYVFAEKNSALATAGSPAMKGYSSNFGAAVFANYKFKDTPYSLGGWLEYFTSNGPDFWFLDPKARGFGLSVTPTWQSKYVFVRGDIGFIHLTSIGDSTSPLFSGGYGTGHGRNQATFVLEAGLTY